jgi:GT2 family glycosyltransferase
MVRTLRGWREPAEEQPVLEDCTLVVPTYQRPDDVIGLLDALDQLPDPPGEVVFVDGSRDERTAEALAARRGTRRHRFDLAYVRSEAGLTRQRNVGIDASTREFVFYLDDDCRPEPGFFREIRDVFGKDARGEVGAVCGSFTNTLRRHLPLRWRLRFRLGLMPRDADPGRYYPTATSVPREVLPAFRGTRDVDLVPGGATAYRRRVFDTHRFSLFFDGYAQGEDVDMSMRIGLSWKKLWSSEALVFHDHAPGGRPAAFRKGRMEIRNRYFIWKRFTPSPPGMVRLRFWLDILFIFAFDLASAAVRPPRLDHLRHAMGIAAGALECVFRPLRYEEPPARREYEFDWVQ